MKTEASLLTQSLLVLGVFGITALTTYGAVTNGGMLNATPYQLRSATADANLSRLTDGKGGPALDTVIAKIKATAELKGGTPVNVTTYNAYIDNRLAAIDEMDNQVRSEFGSDYTFLFQYFYPRVAELKKTEDKTANLLSKISSVFGGDTTVSTAGTSTTVNNSAAANSIANSTVSTTGNTASTTAGTASTGTANQSAVGGTNQTTATATQSSTQTQTATNWEIGSGSTAGNAFVIAIYEGTWPSYRAELNGYEGVADIAIPPEASGKALVLSAYSRTNFRISNPNNVKVNKIVVLGQRVSGDIDNVNVEYLYTYNMSVHDLAHIHTESWRTKEELVQLTADTEKRIRELALLLSKAGLTFTPGNYRGAYIGVAANIPKDSMAYYTPTISLINKTATYISGDKIDIKIDSKGGICTLSSQLKHKNGLTGFGGIQVKEIFKEIIDTSSFIGLGSGTLSIKMDCRYPVDESQQPKNYAPRTPDLTASSNTLSVPLGSSSVVVNSANTSTTSTTVSAQTTLTYTGKSIPTLTVDKTTATAGDAVTFKWTANAEPSYGTVTYCRSYVNGGTGAESYLQGDSGTIPITNVPAGIYKVEIECRFSGGQVRVSPSVVVSATKTPITGIPAGAIIGTYMISSQGNAIAPVTQGGVVIGEVVNGSYWAKTQSTPPAWMQAAYKAIGRNTIDAGGYDYWMNQYNTCGATTECADKLTGYIFAAGQNAGK